MVEQQAKFSYQARQILRAILRILKHAIGILEKLDKGEEV